MTSPTPGAASELQMQKYLTGSDDDLVDVCMQVYARSCMYNTNGQHDAAMAYCAELKRRLRERAPPAPATEGAQREAVAWRYVNADGKRLSEWKDGTPSNDEKASAGLLSLYIELAHSRPISPPPDRVQPRRVEAEASTDDRKQVAAQYLVVATLARNIASVHVDLAGGFVSHVPERMLDMLGARSAEIMETLGDILNGMDAVEESDSWTSQIFDRAHERWPVEQSPAPPTDASGGVTGLDDHPMRDRFAEAIMGALMFGFQQTNRAPEGHWLEQFWNFGNEAADRARTAPQSPAGPKGWSITRVFKSGVEIVPPDGRGLSPKMTMWPAQFSSCDSQMLYALANDLMEGAVILDRAAKP